MNKEQFLLMKLAEECNEVSKRAIKQIQYGASEIQEGQESTNLRRLLDELTDVAVICTLLQEVIPDFKPTDNFDFEKYTEEKVQKLNKYLAYSRKLGQIKGQWKI